MEKFKTWVKLLKEKIEGDPAVDMSTHKPTFGEINNLVYLTCKYAAGFNMRDCDLAVVISLGGDPATVDQLADQFIPTLVDYVWDHLMGEPDNISSKDVEEVAETFIQLLYRMNEHDRNSITQ